MYLRSPGKQRFLNEKVYDARGQGFMFDHYNNGFELVSERRAVKMAGDETRIQ